MKQTFFLLLAVLLAAPLLLTACSAEPVRDVYTASGDAARADDLTKTRAFKADDDLNVVVTLNSHSRELAIKAVFTAPDGTPYPTDALEADETVGEVVLGLDWEIRGTEYWPPGEWKVEIYVDDERAETITFTVNAPAAPNAG
jgi:hypothetical protein